MLIIFVDQPSKPQNQSQNDQISLSISSHVAIRIFVYAQPRRKTSAPARGGDGFPHSAEKG
jgi:hypothetical protein